ncbi:hypothetical protein ACEYW6_30185 [Nostoc sp. UIC 10607]
MAKKDFTPAQAVELYIGNYRFDAIRIVETKEYGCLKITYFRQ